VKLGVAFRVLRQAQREGNYIAINIDAGLSSPHAELVEARTMGGADYAAATRI
jgi:hypothetical protein